MAKLPSVQATGALTKGAASAVSAADIANPYHAMAESLDRLGHTFQAAKDEQAKRDGSGAVYRDDAGDLKVDLQSDLSQSGRAYNRAAQTAYTTRIAGDLRNEGQRIAQEAGNDALAFEKAWEKFSKATVKRTQEQIRGPVSEMLANEGSRLSSGIMAKKYRIDIQTFEADIKAELNFKDDEAATLARNGGVNSQAYLEIQTQIASLYNELVNNPDFSVSQKQAEIALQQMQSRHLGSAIEGQVEQALHKGGVPAAHKLADRLLSDVSLSLSPSERRAYNERVNSAIKSWKAGRKADLKPFQASAKELRKSLVKGFQLDNPKVNDLIANLARGGDAIGAMKLKDDRRLGREVKSFQSFGDSAQVEFYRSAIADGSFSDKLIGVESGGVANAKNPLSSATGLGQFIESTWMDFIRERHPALRSDENVLELRSDPKFSREAIDWLAGKNRTNLSSAGLPVNDGTLYLAHFAGSEGAINLMQAEAGATAQSVLGGAVVKANPFLKGKSAAWVVDWAKSKMASSSGSVDFRLLAEMRSEITSDFKGLWGDIKKGLEDGDASTDEDVDLLYQQLSLIDDEDFKSEVLTFFEGRKVIDASNALRPEQVEKVISILKRSAKDGSNAAQREIIAGLEKAYIKRQETLAQDPLGFGVENGDIDDLSQISIGMPPEELGETLAARQNAVTKMENIAGRSGMSALRPAESSAMAEFFNAAGAQDQAHLLGSMFDNLDDETYMATLEDFSGKSGMKSVAIAGGLWGDNPEVAQGILRGRMLLAENSALAPKNGNQLNIRIGELLPMSAFAQMMEGARQTIIQGAIARYADLSSVAGDQSAELEDDRLQQAIYEITGGMLEFNGSEIIPPSYGMTQEQLDASIAAIGIDDIDGAVDADGGQISLYDFNRFGHLRSVGDNEYVVEFGSVDFPSYAHNASGGPENRYGGGTFIFRFGLSE